MKRLKPLYLLIFLFFIISGVNKGYGSINVTESRTFYGADDLSSSELFPWIDLTSYLTIAHRVQGFVELKVVFDIYPEYQPGSDIGDGIRFTKDDDLYGDNDLRAVADGVFYDMISTNLKKGHLSYEPVMTYGGQDETAIWGPQDNTIIMRFEVPYEIYSYYRVYIGKNFQPWYWRGSTYKAALYLQTPSSGPYAYPDFNRKVVVNTPVDFDGSKSIEYQSEAVITSYQWDFGDGSTAAGVKVSHAYSSIGKYTVKLTVTDSEGYQNSRSINIEVTEAPSFRLKQSSPNPADFNKVSKVKIIFENKEETEVVLKVYSFSGKLIKELLNERKEPGYWSVEWDGKDEDGNDVQPGVYFYKVEAGNYKEVKKMIILR